MAANCTVRALHSAANHIYVLEATTTDKQNNEANSNTSKGKLHKYITSRGFTRSMSPSSKNILSIKGLI